MVLTAELENLLERWPMGRRLPAATIANPDATVVVAGAYKGVVMELLDELYHPPRIVGFEPQHWAREIAAERLRGRDNCFLEPYGIGTRTILDAPMVEFETDGCSFVQHPTAPGREVGVGSLLEISQAFADLAIHQVSLFVMNMEGYEFDLIPHLQRVDLLPDINSLAIQWHTRLGNDRSLPECILALHENHHLVVNEWPQWTLWTQL